MIDQFGVPDWGHESKFKSVPLAKAIWLSLNRNSSTLTHYLEHVREEEFMRCNCVVPGHIKILGKFLDPMAADRYEIVLSWLDLIQIIWRNDALEPMSWLVDLRSFGSCARKYGLTLPDGFPTSEGPVLSSIGELHKAKKIENEQRYSVELPYITKEIEILFKVKWKIHSMNPKPIKKEIESLISDTSKEYEYHFSKSAIEQYATLITPDEIAEKNLRSRKHPRNQQKKLGLHE